MRILTIAILLLLSACAKAGPGAPDPSPAPVPVTRVTCAQYDACTYSGGFNSHALYVCTQKTYVATAHPEIPASYFNGETCLTTSEDYRVQNSVCGPMNFPCQIQVQGPGAKALPTLNL